MHTHTPNICNILYNETGVYKYMYVLHNDLLR